MYLLIIQIRQVPEAALGRCQRLTSLDLSHNNLSTLASESFSSVPQLQALNLSSCGLASVAPGSLDSLRSLASLDLGYNQLTSVPTSRLAMLASLKTLVLSGNLVSQLGAHSFREVHKLQQVYMSNCPLLR